MRQARLPLGQDRRPALAVVGNIRIIVIFDDQQAGFSIHDSMGKLHFGLLLECDSNTICLEDRCNRYESTDGWISLWNEGR